MLGNGSTAAATTGSCFSGVRAWPLMSVDRLEHTSVVSRQGRAMRSIRAWVSVSVSQGEDRDLRAEPAGPRCRRRVWKPRAKNCRAVGPAGGGGQALDATPAQPAKKNGVTACAVTPRRTWLRGLDLNQRPLGYEQRPACYLAATYATLCGRSLQPGVRHAANPQPPCMKNRAVPIP